MNSVIPKSRRAKSIFNVYNHKPPLLPYYNPIKELRVKRSHSKAASINQAPLNLTASNCIQSIPNENTINDNLKRPDIELYLKRRPYRCSLPSLKKSSMTVIRAFVTFDIELQLYQDEQQ